MNENLIPKYETTSERLPAWDGSTYAANTGHHRAYDEWFLNTFPARPADRLLDIGCGAGDFTAKVAALVPAGSVLGIDASSSMVDTARRFARPNQRFAVGAAQHLAELVREEAPFDGIFSRATFQWIPRTDLPTVVTASAEALQPGGWLRVEAGGAGNIAAIVEMLAEVSARHGGPPPPWSFLDAGEGLSLVERAGLVLDAGDGRPAGYVRTVAQRRAFDAHTLRGWFESQCLQAFDTGDPMATAALRHEVLGRLDELRRHDGSYDQTFVRLDLLAYRPQV